MTKNIWVFGAHGMLGSMVCKVLQTKGHTVHPFSRHDLDLSTPSYDSIHALLTVSQSGDVIVNCAGVIPQRGESDISTFLHVNSIFPMMLSTVAVQKQLHMIHVSTDCVFDGKRGAYTEDDPPSEKGWYGLSKGLGDHALACILRTSIIGIETGGYSFLGFCRRNHHQRIQGYANHFWNGMTTLQLSTIIEEIIANNLYWTGVRHLFSPSPVSKYELAQIINQSCGLGMEIERIMMPETIDKTLTTVFDTCYRFQIPPIETQIIQLVETESV